MAAVATSAQPSVRAVRSWWRAAHPPPSLGQRLDLLYTVTITTAIFGAVAYGAASSALAEVVSRDVLAVWGPPLALVALLVTAGSGAYQGPVVFSVADVGLLLGAPLRRRSLTAGRLVRGMALGAAAGACLAAVAIVGLTGEGIAVSEAAGLCLGFGLCGTLAVAAAWEVERSAGWELAVRRATAPGLLVAAALAWASAAGGAWREVALWSGPWGWAMQPAAGAGQPLAALLLLALVAVGAAVVAVRRCGDCPAERHMRRAEARAGAVASAMSFDARTARLSLQRVGARGRGRDATNLPRLRAVAMRRPAAAIAWRDAVAALRAPRRVVDASLLAGAGVLLCVLQVDRPAAVAVGVLAAYCGAARMLGTTRSELDAPERARLLLRPRVGRVLRAHAALPALVVTAAATVAAAGCAVAGVEDLAAAPFAVAAALVVTCCAALSARRRGRLPLSVLSTAVAADPAGGAAALMAWLAWWPAAAAVLAGVPLLLASQGAVAIAAGWTVVAVAVLVRVLDRDPVEI